MVAFTQEGKAKLLYCSQWGCPNCRVTKSREWMRIARFGVHYGQAGRLPIVFWTLTLGSAYTNVVDGYKAIPRLWDTFRKEIQREQGRFDYLAFVEGQPKRSFMPHFHVLAFARVPSYYNERTDPRNNIKDFAAHVGFGYQSKEKIVDSDGAAYYVSKYVSKGSPDIPKGFRRVRCSRSWPKPPDDPKKPYLVRGVGEQITDFILRVEAISGRDADELVREYQDTRLRMEIERLDDQ